MTATSDTLLSTPPAELVAADLTALVATTPAAERYAVLSEWSRQRVAAEAASLANTGGGVVIIGAQQAAGGAISGFAGGGASMAGEIASIASDLGPAGAHLVAHAIVDVGGAPVGVIRVAESVAPPVLVETDGAIYNRTAAGCTRVLTRAGLDALTGRERSLRERAEKNLNAMVTRNESGHFNYMTLAVTIAPRVTGAGPYAWANSNQAALVDRSRGLAARWSFEPGFVGVSAGEIVVAPAGEVGGFLRISRNGTVAAGEHLRRPPSATFIPATELADRLRAMVELAALPLRGAGGGLVVAAVSVECVRDLRLNVEGGLSRPASRDTATVFVAERYLEDDSELAQLTADVLAAAGALWGADLVAGTGAYAGEAEDSTNDARTWHGITRRTERRVAGARGHGSAR
ncbi:MAG: ATP-binding protein [Dehalococcoidia bacterium]|nr:ATP-binding protein [Dehalococcoidia bacterium]